MFLIKILDLSIKPVFLFLSINLLSLSIFATFEKTNDNFEFF